MKWYIGVTKNYQFYTFKAKNEPTRKTYGDKYIYCYGGYPTKRQAQIIARKMYLELAGY